LLKLSTSSLATFFAMTDPKNGGDPIDLVSKIPPRTNLIFRHYHEENREDMAKRVVKECRKAKIKCLISQNVDLAVRLRADGIHLPEHILKRLGTRPKVHKKMIVTAATHSLPMIFKAQKIGLDAAIVSPVYFTRSHPDATPLGILKIAFACTLSSIPIIALGGVKAKNFTELRLAGVSGFAGITLFN